MPWLKGREAARALGISQGSLRERARRGKIQRRIVDAWTSLYLVGEEDVSDSRTENEFPREQDQGRDVDLGDVKPDGNDTSSAYYYDETRDKYVFALRSKGHRPFAVSGDVVRSAVQAYSRDGSDATINEVSRTNGWHRATTREILKALGKTHDSSPFTDEDIAQRSEDELVDDVVRLKEEKVLVRAEREDWNKTKKLAEEARRLDQFLLRRIEAIISSGGWAPPAQAPSIHLDQKSTDTPAYCVFGLTDAHIGAHAWAKESGRDNNIEIVRERTLSTTRRLIERVCSFRAPSRWLLPSGSDNIHADTRNKTTTKGTPLDTDGSHTRMFLAACGVYEEIVAMLLQVAPVEIVAMPGNHDFNTTVALTAWLSARFRDDQFVRVGPPTEVRAYRLIGNTLVCFTHGEKEKHKDQCLTMASEVPHLWGLAKHRLIFSGHLHSDIVHETKGTRQIHMPTLALEDQWSFTSGYIGNTKAISAYLIDHEEGLVASLPVQPPTSTP